ACAGQDVLLAEPLPDQLQCGFGRVAKNLEHIFNGDLFGHGGGIPREWLSAAPSRADAATTPAGTDARRAIKKWTHRRDRMKRPDATRRSLSGMRFKRGPGGGLLNPTDTVQKCSRKGTPGTDCGLALDRANSPAVGFPRKEDGLPALQVVKHSKL